MSKEKEIVLIFRDVLDRTNELADAVKCSPIDIEFIRERRKSYLSKYKEDIALLDLPASEVTDNFMFKLMYGGFSATMKNLVMLIGLYYKNVDHYYGVEEEKEKFNETLAEIEKFRTECNKKFKKVEAQLASIGHVD